MFLKKVLLFLVATLLSLTPIRATVTESLQTLATNLQTLQTQLRSLNVQLNSLNDAIKSPTCVYATEQSYKISASAALEQAALEEAARKLDKKSNTTKIDIDPIHSPIASPTAPDLTDQEIESHDYYPLQKNINPTAYSEQIRWNADNNKPFPLLFGYYQTPYIFYEPLASICFSKDAQLSFPSFITTQTNNKTIKFYCLLLGPQLQIFEPTEATRYLSTTGINKDVSINIVFHDVIKEHNNLMHFCPDFNEYSSMGLFNPNGITKDDLNFNSLSQIQVYWHTAYSPCNAKYKLTQNRTFATFWFVGVYKDIAYVTYVLQASTHPVATKIREAFNTLTSCTSPSSTNTAQLITALSHVRNSTSWVNAADASAFAGFVETFTRLCTRTIA